MVILCRMKTALIIPEYKQTRYFPTLLKAINSMSVKPDKVVYYMDRPTGRERVEIMRTARDTIVDVRFNTTIPEFVGHPQMNYDTEYFLAGCIRNKVLFELMDEGFDTFIFIDGDCVPEPGLIESHCKLLDSETPVVSVGQRKENKWGDADQRVASPLSNVHIFYDVPFKVAREFWFVDSGVVWTCNFGMNLAAVQELIKLNTICYGRCEVFSSDFTGTWGGEDGFIGLECFYLKIPVWTIPFGKNAVHHIDHERPQNKYDHTTFIDFLEARREELVCRMHLNHMNVAPFVSRIKLYEESR